MTISIAARCERTGAFGVAISSSSPAVGSRCPNVRAGIGAVSSQNITDPRLGPALLDALESGLAAQAALDSISAVATHPEFRQLTVVDAIGAAAVFSGAKSLGINAEVTANNVAAAGNMLANDGVIQAMVDSFAATPDKELADRLIGALEAGVAAGGEAGPVHSAAVLVATQVSWPTTNLRVDWDENPIVKLREIYEVWAPQAQDYLTRALNPNSAPSYGVPGDE
ncbi:MAG: DUF1028 domain-containing protein [Candidatus Nanopelagicales bacterium]|jgi:uncharacterized Ntn-hydrolase superfamily protein|nr:DUF1028 domain-containing protein [Candidatus Nanopelagicales bacterium]MDP4667075.1 DUF1028 domain-containing protein [Candidatus Nanopelagicales bacterium]MDP4895989.1 DUF1028 domain-containing protein [Candidatus Nanopelagicales bacterium]MDP5050747.1 DUF1028 domain-containing protein [Candidatus Nanopelagicales bacterium]